MGILQIVLNKPLFITAEKYTEESLQRYVRAGGTAYILIGGTAIGFLYTLRGFFDQKVSGWLTVAFLAAMVVSIICGITAAKKLVNKMF